MSVLGKPVKVKILDNEYLIKSDEDLDTVFKIADYVNDKIEEINKKSEGLSDKKMAVLVALNIASDYFQLLKERDDLLSNIKQRSRTMVYNIDSLAD